jgi:hypothetical protein
LCVAGREDPAPDPEAACVAGADDELGGDGAGLRAADGDRQGRSEDGEAWGSRQRDADARRGDVPPSPRSGAVVGVAGGAAPVGVGVQLIGIGGERALVAVVEDAVIVVVGIARVRDAVPVGVRLLRVRALAAAVERVDHPVAVPIALACIADAVGVGIRLTGIDVDGTAITRVGNAVGIVVGIADVTRRIAAGARAVGVALIGVASIGAVVGLVEDAVAVDVARLGMRRRRGGTPVGAPGRDGGEREDQRDDERPPRQSRQCRGALPTGS